MTKHFSIDNTKFSSHYVEIEDGILCLTDEDVVAEYEAIDDDWSVLGFGCRKRTPEFEE
jgi:hypothetical protein